MSLDGLKQLLSEFLRSKNGSLGDSKEISYGIQFLVNFGDCREVVRLFSSKKGEKLDVSQIKNERLAELLEEFRTSNNLLGSKKSKPRESKKTTARIVDPLPIIGVDESGKGDYFGPLVTAAVYVDERMNETLKILGVQDSKNLGDAKIRELSKVITDTCPYSVVAIGCERYNSMYEKIGNLNKLLAWSHARAIENVLEKQDCSDVLSDQFGSERLVKDALKQYERPINLHQRPRAEENIAVAAASIVARDKFVGAIKGLSRQYKIDLPKGNSQKVIRMGKEFVSQYGEAGLSKVAKMHFVTTQKIKG